MMPLNSYVFGLDDVLINEAGALKSPTLTVVGQPVPLYPIVFTLLN